MFRSPHSSWYLWHLLSCHGNFSCHPECHRLIWFEMSVTDFIMYVCQVQHFVEFPIQFPPCFTFPYMPICPSELQEKNHRGQENQHPHRRHTRKTAVAPISRNNTELIFLHNAKKEVILKSKITSLQNRHTHISGLGVESGERGGNWITGFLLFPSSPISSFPCLPPLSPLSFLPLFLWPTSLSISHRIRESGHRHLVLQWIL